jgi:hypothetical protein
MDFMDFRRYLRTTSTSNHGFGFGGLGLLALHPAVAGCACANIEQTLIQIVLEFMHQTLSWFYAFCRRLFRLLGLLLPGLLDFLRRQGSFILGLSGHAAAPWLLRHRPIRV